MKKYCCDVCKLIFDDEEELREHLQSVEERKDKMYKENPTYLEPLEDNLPNTPKGGC